MVIVWRRETPPPTTAEREPVARKERPYLSSGERGRDVSHPQVSRQRWASCVETRRRKRIDFSLQKCRSETADDPEPRPTKPLGGKLPRRPRVKINQHICESWVQNPASR